MPVADALGLALAEPVKARHDLPPFANSAMDGYAVHAEDTKGATEASPRELRVIGEVAAGYVFEGAVGPGTAVRIMTGAVMPEGTDTVIMREQVEEHADAGGESTIVVGEGHRPLLRPDGKVLAEHVKEAT